LRLSIHWKDLNLKVFHRFNWIFNLDILLIMEPANSGHYALEFNHFLFVGPFPFGALRPEYNFIKTAGQFII